jgi:hypothetical protein
MFILEIISVLLLITVVLLVWRGYKTAVQLRELENFLGSTLSEIDPMINAIHDIVYKRDLLIADPDIRIMVDVFKQFHKLLTTYKGVVVEVVETVKDENEGID